MARPASPYGLQPKQWRFVQEYLKDLNGTQAALRAGYSPKTANEQACQLLAKLHVQEAVAAEQAARLARVHLEQDAVLQEIAVLAHSDYTNYTIDDEGNMVVREGITPLASRAVSSLKKRIIPTEAGPIYETEVRLWNKPAALKLAGDHLGLFLEKLADSADVQAAHKARQDTIGDLRGRLQTMATRHAQEVP